MQNNTTLFLGGPWDGRRMAVQDGRREVRVLDRADLPNANLYLWDPMEFNQPSPMKEHRYRVISVSSAPGKISLALHESLDGRDPFQILVARYPQPIPG